MRTIAIIFLTFLLFAGCNKDKYGNLVHKMKYTSSKELNMKAGKGLADELHYTQFGDYITSVTPSSFIGEFDLIRIYGVAPNDHDSGNPPVFMTLILSNSMEDNVRFADFSNNAEITLTPGLSGPLVRSNSNETGNCFKVDAIFKLLQINLYDIKQSIELPVQYNGVNLSQFNGQYSHYQYSNDLVKNGNILTVDMYPLTGRRLDGVSQIKPSDTSPFTGPITFYFGMIDKTTLYSTGPSLQYPSSLNQQNGEMSVPFVWSNKFNEFTLKPPVYGETETIITTIGFDNENLIQIYAGADNIPYTSDDIIVYAPNFWERIYIKVTVD
jgi:hypothetical protein